MRIKTTFSEKPIPVNICFAGRTWVIVDSETNQFFEHQLPIETGERLVSICNYYGFAIQNKSNLRKDLVNQLKY